MVGIGKIDVKIKNFLLTCGEGRGTLAAPKSLILKAFFFS
jgi:hypothetical protein